MFIGGFVKYFSQTKFVTPQQNRWKCTYLTIENWKIIFKPFWSSSVNWMIMKLVYMSEMWNVMSFVADTCGSGGKCGDNCKCGGDCKCCSTTTTSGQHSILVLLYLRLTTTYYIIVWSQLSLRVFMTINLVTLDLDINL